MMPRPVMPRWLSVKELVAWVKLRRGAIVDPTQRAPLAPQAIVEQQRAMRGYTAAKPAAEWTEDITKANAEVAATYEAEVARRTALFERGEYTPRFGSVENDMVFEMRTTNVTGLEPAQRILTPEELRDARTLAGLTTEVQTLEAGKPRRVTMPQRPTPREIMAAVGGDVARARQLQTRLDDLYGEEE